MKERIANILVLVLVVSHGLGRHYNTLSAHDSEAFFKLLLAFECLYVTAVALIKLSLLQMYLRIFPSREFRIAAWIIGGTVVAWWLAIVLVCIFQCDPISKAWLPMSAGKCINLKASFIGNAVPNIITDVAILCMPIKQVWQLHVTTTQKLSLLCAFLLGSFVLIASIYRFTTIMAFNMMDTTGKFLCRARWPRHSLTCQPAGTLATACTWCVVETGCGVICACLPTLRPLAKKVSSQFSSTGNKSSRSRTGAASRGPNELVTIGGTGGSKHAISRNKFSRLGKDDPNIQLDSIEYLELDNNGNGGHRQDSQFGNRAHVSAGDRDEARMDGGTLHASQSGSSHGHNESVHGKGFV